MMPKISVASEFISHLYQHDGEDSAPPSSFKDSGTFGGGNPISTWLLALVPVSWQIGSKMKDYMCGVMGKLWEH
jgi:hypothetical protein